LIITFFLQFFPELIKKGHVYVLQTPLFRVRNRRTKIKDKKVIADADAYLQKGIGAAHTAVAEGFEMLASIQKSAAVGFRGSAEGRGNKADASVFG